VFVGQLLGTLAVPYLCERFGRKATLLVSNGCVLCAALAGWAAIPLKRPLMLLVSRLFGCGAETVIFVSLSLILTECPAAELRAVCYATAGFTVSLGMLVGMALGTEFLLGSNLSLLMGFAILPCLLAFLLIFQLKETPKFLLMKKNDPIGARRSLAFYQGYKIDHELFFESSQKEQEAQQADAGDQTETEQQSMPAMLKAFLFRTHLRKAFFIGLCSVQQLCGIWPYTTMLLSEHFHPSTAQIVSSVGMGISTVAGVIGVFAAKKLSRRKLFISSALIAQSSVLFYTVFDRLSAPSGLGFTYLRFGCIFAIFSNNFANGFAVGPIALSLIPELLPQNFRSFGHSLTSVFGLTIGFTFSLLTLPAYAAIGTWAFLPLFVGPGFACIVFLVCSLPETRGREIHEIIEELRR